MNKNIIWIKCKTDNYYKVISKIEPLKINIFDIKYIDKVLYLKLTQDDYQKINKYIISYKFQKYKDTGLNKLKNYLKQDKIFIICLFIGIILFICINNMIFKINIVHESSTVRTLIKEELDNYGIKVLSFKKNYNKLEQIKQEILDKHPDKLDWMEFETKGMILNVKVEERIITNTKKEDKTCDIIAKKEGLITDFKVINGEVLININDYVNKGDTLISGIIKYNDEEKRYTCASGEVYATTWYTANVSIPFKYSEYEKEGKTRYNLVWEYNDIKHEIFKNRLKNYESNYKTLLKIFGLNIYLDKQISIRKINKEYTEEEATNIGVEKAIESITKKLSKKDTIIDKKVLKKVKNNSTMDIEVFIVVKELISIQKEIDVKKD